MCHANQDYFFASVINPYAIREKFVKARNEELGRKQEILELNRGKK